MVNLVDDQCATQQVTAGRDMVAIMNEALEELNVMLLGWANDDLLIPYRTRENFTLVAGTYEYTIGTAGDFNTVRPLTILSPAFLRLSGLDTPVRHFTLDEHNAILNKDAPGRPERFNFEEGDPLGLIRFDRSPDQAYAFYIDSLKAITEFSSVTAEDSFPDRYVDTVRLNLAVRLAPEHLGEDAPTGVIVAARNALQALTNKTAASRTGSLELDLALQPRRQAFNIDRGYD